MTGPIVKVPLSLLVAAFESMRWGTQTIGDDTELLHTKQWVDTYKALREVIDQAKSRDAKRAA